ncbi:hypothetical protein SDJN03_21574, partial [Cucurbita argyrosperma subsp. sororia]
MSFPLFSLCFGSFHEYPLFVSQYHDLIYGHYPKPRWNTGFYGSTTRQDRVSSLSGSPKVVNVDDFGAKGNGQDDSKAFELAWKEACSSSKAMILVPKGRTYYLKSITFSGPCRSPLTLKIDGIIKASPRMSDYDHDRRHWLKFEGVDNFVVEGNGIINGNGKKWWQNSCKVNKELPCRRAPTAVTFYQCINLVVANLKLENAQQMHLTFQKCTNVQALNLRVVAPENSPNTDGIHVTETQNVIIKNCVIGTGDDCISIVSGSRNVRAMDITCGPGHGISIGSLGAGNSEAEVSNIRVDRALISGTSNGVRIKTWQNSAVKVSNVVYKNIRGTSASDDAIRFDCSKSSPCQDISMLGVHLVRQGDDVATASCENVRLKNRWKVYPQCSS